LPRRGRTSWRGGRRPLAPDRDTDLDDLFSALDFRRLRLRQDTQVAEWAGIHPA
jgi:hypothetical protein